MNSEAIKVKSGYILDSYARFDLVLESARGCVAKSPEGKEYLDFTSGIGVNSLGWCDEAWTAAVTAQAGTLQHTSNLYYTAPGAALAEALCARTSMAKVFFSNSGAESNEGAIKAARKYSRDKYGEGRHTVVALVNSFHGRTMATLAATGQDVFHDHFHPFPGGFEHLPANEFDALAARLALGGVCAVLAEPVQGEGGVEPLDREYFQAVAALCKEKDVLLIADEVQTGVGRTGRFLAVEHFGVQPDIISLAKGLGGGLPIGAVLFNEKTAEVLGRGDHATTYGMNPVCCAGANVVLDRLDDSFLAGVAEKGKALKAGLLALPGVASVEGLGLMLGVTFREGIAAIDVLKAAMARGMLCLTAKHKLRLLPPLVISEDEIETGLSILKSVLEGLV